MILAQKANVKILSDKIFNTRVTKLNTKISAQLLNVCGHKYKDVQ